MDKLKQWVALTVVACLAIAAAGWFLLVSPKRAEAATLRQQAADQVSKNAAQRTQLQVLKAQAKDLPKEQAKLAAVATKIPDNPALPALVRDLLDAASGAGVELVSITPGQPALATAATPAKPVAPATGAAAPAAPAAAAPAAATAPRTGSGGSAGQLAHIPVSLNVAGDYFEIQQFLAAVEDLPRAVRVENLTMAPGTSPTDKTAASSPAASDGRKLTATIAGDAYMAANRPAAVTATVPAASAPTASPAK
jgi:Tfp pilus assembly protein PilO